MTHLSDTADVNDITHDDDSRRRLDTGHHSNDNTTCQLQSAASQQRGK